MSPPGKRRFVLLRSLLAERHPGTPQSAISDGHVLVDGRFVTNPNARVRNEASVRVVRPARLRGDIKLSYALEALSVVVANRTALDVGASAGGFTTALLNHGARRVYALDAGTGQLLGRLRRDPRVVNLEGVNLGELAVRQIPEVLDVITMDLSYLRASDALGQLVRVSVRDDADLIVLVKPTFELRSGRMVEDDAEVSRAVNEVAMSMRRNHWIPGEHCPAPRTGRHLAPEVFLHGRRESEPLIRHDHSTLAR